MAESRQAGFTLVEMLVGLALAALIGVLLVNAVRITGTASSAVARTILAEDVQSVRDHLRRTLGSLARRRVDGTRPALRGGPDGLQAVIGPDRSVERVGDIAVTLAAIPRGDGTVDLTESRAPLDAGAGSVPTAEVILERVSGITFRYFGSLAERTRPAWHAAWASSERQPSLLEIEIAFAPADRRRWPPLLIPLTDRP